VFSKINNAAFVVVLGGIVAILVAVFVTR